MSTYQIKTSTITFEVTAEDSDMACLAANQEIQRRGMPFESQRAELVLLDGDNSLSLGTFSLTGFELPTTWAAISELRKDLLAAAKADAANNWDLRIIRSRGAVLVAEDAEGKTLLATGDSWDMPKTLKGFKAALETIKSQFPTAAKVFICIGCDSAESVNAMNDSDYTPWSGEAQALVHIYPESAYTLTESCPEKAIIQHSETGDYNYSEHSSMDAAWEAEKGESWVKDHPEGEEEAKAEFLATLCEYSRSEILAAACEGYGWPEDLGFVKAKE